VPGAPPAPGPRPRPLGGEAERAAAGAAKRPRLDEGAPASAEGEPTEAPPGVDGPGAAASWRGAGLPEPMRADAPGSAGGGGDAAARGRHAAPPLADEDDGRPGAGAAAPASAAGPPSSDAGALAAGAGDGGAAPPSPAAPAAAAAGPAAPRAQLAAGAVAGEASPMTPAGAGAAVGAAAPATVAPSLDFGRLAAEVAAQGEWLAAAAPNARLPRTWPRVAALAAGLAEGRSPYDILLHWWRWFPPGVTPHEAAIMLAAAARLGGGGGGGAGADGGPGVGWGVGGAGPPPAVARRGGGNTPHAAPPEAPGDGAGGVRDGHLVRSAVFPDRLRLDLLMVDLAPHSPQLVAAIAQLLDAALHGDAMRTFGHLLSPLKVVSHYNTLGRGAHMLLNSHYVNAVIGEVAREDGSLCLARDASPADLGRHLADDGPVCARARAGDASALVGHWIGRSELFVKRVLPGFYIEPLCIKLYHRSMAAPDKELVTFEWHEHGSTHILTAVAGRFDLGGRYTILIQLREPLKWAAALMLRDGTRGSEEAFHLSCSNVTIMGPDSEGKVFGPDGEPRMQHARIARGAELSAGGMTLMLSARLDEGVARAFPSDAACEAARGVDLQLQGCIAAAWGEWLARGAV
jgi:hypothetical protein